MKKIFLAVLTAGTLHTATTAQTNSTNREANGGGHMNNRGVGVDDGTTPPAGRDGAMRTDGSTTAMERGDATVTIGGMSRTEFDRMNAEGNQKVAAISPTSTPLTKEDQKLLVQMAQGGMTQLQVSQAALGRVQRDDVRLLAQSEVEEQTGVSAKIMEIAKAKGMVLNTEPTAAAAQMIERMQGPDARNIDRFYTRESGVDGHEKLLKTGEKIMREAQDPALKALADATAPVIKMHMQVSQGVLSQMGRGNANGNGKTKPKGNGNGRGGGNER
jgi:putative membrane protein